MKAKVFMQATTSVMLTVDVPDDIDDIEERREAAIEAAYRQGVPSICAHCSGWNQPWSRDEGEFEVIDDPDAVEFEAVPDDRA